METTGLVVRKSVTVDAPIERAFEVFTEGLATWWPLDRVSINADRGRGRPDGAVFESHAGGMVYEHLGGERSEWADVLAFERPDRVVLRWRVNPEHPPTEVEVLFTSEGESTRVDLEHRGWEAYGERAAESHAGYDSGWEPVLDSYRQTAARV